MSLITIAQIDRFARDGLIGTMTSQQLQDAHHAVLFARDPAHLGDEPHLRCEVDADGLDDDRLVEIESALWMESDRRQRQRPAAPQVEYHQLRLAA